MAIDFASQFAPGKNKPAAAATGKPKAEFWLNIGYEVEGAGKDGADAFVSLPTGIPLDTQEKLPTNSNNEEFAQLQAARNALQEQLLEWAQANLKPGEDAVFNMSVQVRRVKEDKPVSTGSDNKFVRALNFTV